MTENDKFVRAADGIPVRFFGVNLAFGASFPRPQDAARVAKRLRRLGVNLVRPCVKAQSTKLPYG
jgi:hypothetical protein